LGVLYSKQTMSISTLHRSIRQAKKNGDNQRVKIELYRLKQFEDHKRRVDIDIARNEMQGPVLTKKEIVDLWNQQFGHDKIFGDCTLCEHTNKVNPIYAHVIELRKTKTKIFVCPQCKENAVTGWIQKRTISPVVEKQRLEVWLNANMVRRRTMCFCCRQVQMDMLSSDWHVGHIIAEAHGGSKTLDNLRPICSGCNQDMSTKEMYLYMREKYSNVAIEQAVDVEALAQCLRLFKI
jgi:hypothetical protein